MLKLLGSACILGGGVLTVWLQLRERRKMRETLAQMISSLRRMAEEIQACRTPLPRLLERLASGCTGEAAAFFAAVSGGIRRGEPAGRLWQECACRLSLPTPARQAIAEAGKSLNGTEDSVCHVIFLVIKELEKSAAEWDNQRQETEKRTAALWLSAAALTIILLI